MRPARPSAARCGSMRRCSMRCKLKMGDDLLLGDAALKITRLIVVEPDRGAGFMSFAPRVMVNHADLAATGLVQPASRVTYRLAVASPIGRDADVAAYVRWAEAQVEQGPLRGVRVESMETGRPEMKPDAGPGREVPQPGRAAGGAAGGGGGGDRLARLRQRPPRRLRDAARAGPAAALDRAAPTRSSSACVGALASAVGVLLGLAVHYVFVWPARRAGERRAAARRGRGRRCSASASA